MIYKCLHKTLNQENLPGVVKTKKSYNKEKIIKNRKKIQKIKYKSQLRFTSRPVESLF